MSSGPTTAESLDLVLTEIRMAARDTNLYTFERADKAHLPGAEPGAHIGVILPNGIERQYSLTHSGASLNRYTVGVKRDAIVVLKSTVPVGTNDKVQKLFDERAKVKVTVVSNPEFLKEGAAIDDFLRPDRIVVGECRGGEALDMLQAMNTGHEGSLTTIHANSARDALSRLETMVAMANPAPFTMQPTLPSSFTKLRLCMAASTSVGSSSVVSRRASRSAWRIRELSSRFILQSTAMIFSSLVLNSGLISSIDMSFATKAV